MRPEDLAPLAVAAFNGRDSSALRRLWADDILVQAPDGEHVGIDAKLAQEENLWRAFPDVRASIRTVAIGPDALAQETTLTGTHGGVLKTSAGDIAPTGRPFTMTMAVHVWFRDGRVCREQVFYDRLALMRQLGLA